MTERNRQPECHDPDCDKDREGKMVWATRKAFCDPCIAHIVKALNEAGMKTVASCCGHGHRPGSIALKDGREIIIARSFEESQMVHHLFSTDVNGDVFPPARNGDSHE